MEKYWQVYIEKDFIKIKNEFWNTYQLERLVEDLKKIESRKYYVSDPKDLICAIENEIEKDFSVGGDKKKVNMLDFIIENFEDFSLTLVSQEYDYSIDLNYEFGDYYFYGEHSAFYVSSKLIDGTRAIEKYLD